MVREHSIISISESGASQKHQLDKGKGPADLHANQFNAEIRSKLAGEAKEGQYQRVDDDPFYLLDRRRKERRKGSRARYSSSVSIYNFPPKLPFGSLFVREPELVSIGPCYRGKNHLLEFEDHKLTFLNEFLSISKENLQYHMISMKRMEDAARQCYQQVSNTSSNDFVEMMILDGCFIIVLLHILGGHRNVVGNKDYDFILTVPWRIPCLKQDLVKMENQLPFFVLDYLFPFYKVTNDKDNDKDNDIDNDLPVFALNVFSLSFPMHLDTQRFVNQIPPLHLLELVYQSLLPPKLDLNEPDDDKQRHPSNQPIQSVTRLRLSGIKFRSTTHKTTSFLDIKYKKQVLEIPTITITDYTKCLLINCVAWEQSHQYQSRTFSYFTDYVAFMNVLISEPRDVAFLCADGIISKYSQGDGAVAFWFYDFQEHLVFNNRNSYVSEELRKLEVDFSSYWATVLRTYFSSPWSFISVFTAFLLIVCSLIQSIMSIVSYKAHPK